MLFFPSRRWRAGTVGVDVGQTAAMASPADSQLSAIAASVEDLALRVTAIADELSGVGASDASSTLFEVERSLQTAARSLERARRSLDG